MDQVAIKKTVKHFVTTKIIELHSHGYEYDFYLVNSKLTCLQDNKIYSFEQLQVRVVDHYYDLTERTYQYIHTIEDEKGVKGVLISNKAYSSVPFWDQ